MDTSNVSFTSEADVTVGAITVKKKMNVVSGFIDVAGAFPGNTNTKLGELSALPNITGNQDLWFPLYVISSGAMCGILRINASGSVRVLPTTAQSAVRGCFTYICT